MRNCLAALALTAFVSPCFAQSTFDDVLTSLKSGSFSGDFRLRHEMVTQDGNDNTAQATTFRTALSYRSGAFKSWTAFVQMEAVADIVEDYNDAAGNGKTEYPVVADPSLAEVNQVYLKWSRDGTSLTVGRQEIVTGDARFVGNVGWRQNHQSYDAIRLVSTSLEPVEVSYSFVDRSHRIFGDDLAMQGHLGRVSVPLKEVVTLSAYATLLDFDDLAALSTQTFGAEARGSLDATEKLKVNYAASFAKQQDAYDNTSTVDATYSFFRLGAQQGNVSLAVAQETLGGESGNGRFLTPLATLHKFNGWADRFLLTPTEGLVDRYVSVGLKRGAMNVLAVYHDFTSDSGDSRYGSELDLQVTYSVSGKPALGAKVARYTADTHSVDGTKFWLWTSLRI